MILPNPPKAHKKDAKSPAKRKKLTERQRQFFKCLEQEGYNMNRAVMLCKIKDWLMDRWFKDPLFIATLKNRYRQIEFRTHMELTYHLPLASMNLINMTNGFDTDTMMKACTNILRFHNNSRAFHEYAFEEKDRPRPNPRLRRKNRFPKEKIRPKPPELDLSREFLEETHADDYKRQQKLNAYLEQRRLQSEKGTPRQSTSETLSPDPMRIAVGESAQMSAEPNCGDGDYSKDATLDR